MNSTIRVFNILNSIKIYHDANKVETIQQPSSGNKYSTSSLLMMKSILDVKNDDDVLYLKPFLLEEVTCCQTELQDKYDADNSQSIINPILTYFNRHCFCSLSSYDLNENLNKNKAIQTNFPSSYFKDITQLTALERKNIKTDNEEVEKQKNEILQQIDDAYKTINNIKNEYIKNFILKNLNKIEILIKNYDKILPKHRIVDAIFPIIPIIYYKDATEIIGKDIITTIKQLFTNCNDFVEKKFFTSALTVNGLLDIYNKFPTIF